LKRASIKRRRLVKRLVYGLMLGGAVSLTADSQLFKQCVVCHGADGSNKALGMSQVIKGWKPEKIKASILKYQGMDKSGSFGKQIMYKQVKDLSAEQVESLAKYISEL
jgi:cytochrome c553